MRRISTLLSIVILLASSGAGADEYQSSFGFSTSVPEGWVILSREELRENPDLFDHIASDPELAALDGTLKADVMERIQTGQIELLFRPLGLAPDPVFADNVNVLKQVAKLPNAEQLDATCLELPGAFGQYFGRPIEIHTCKLTNAAGRPALQLEFDGAAEGTTSVQYQIQRTENITLIVTATAANQRLGAMKKDFQAIIDGLKF